MSENLNIKDVRHHLGGVSFIHKENDPVLFLKPLDCIAPKKSSLRRTVDATLDSILSGNTVDLNLALDNLASPVSSVSLRLITSAFVKNFSPDIAETLDRRGFFYHKLVMESVLESKDYRAFLWMCKDEASVKRAELKIGVCTSFNHPSKKTPRSLFPFLRSMPIKTLSENISKIDLPVILRRECKMNIIQNKVETFIKDSFYNSQISIELFAPVLSAIMSDDVISSASSKDAPGTLSSRKALFVEPFIESLSHGSLDTFARCELLLAHCPTFEKAWLDYWNLKKEHLVGLEKELDVLGNPIPISLIVHKKASDLLFDKEFKIYSIAPVEDVLDLAVIKGLGWVADTLDKPGVLHDEIVKRLKKDYNLLGFVSSLGSKRLIDCLPRLLNVLGSQWKDSSGGNLAHSIFKINSLTTPAVCRLLAGLDGGHEMLLCPDDNGSSPLDMLSKLSETVSGIDQSFMSSFSRKVLSSNMVKVKRQSQLKRNIRM